MNRHWSLGIRERLFIAFGSVAAMTVIASVAAWLSYANISQSLGRIANTHVPAMTSAAQLAEKGGAIIATAPALVAAADEREQRAIWADLAVILADMRRLLHGIDGPLVDLQSQETLRKLVEGISTNLDALNANVDRQFSLRSHMAEQADRLRWLHADFLDEVEPMIEEARFNIETALENMDGDASAAAAQSAALRRELRKREALLKINAAGNLVVSLLDRAMVADSDDEVEFAGHQLTDTARNLYDNLKVLEGPASSVSLRQIVDDILALAQGAGGPLALRKRELATQQEGRRLLADNRRMVGRLKTVIADRVSALEAATMAAAEDSKRSIVRGRYFLALMAGLSLVIAVVVGWLYVGRSIVARITALGRSMRAIAAGRLNTPVPTGGNDEIAEMAKALLVFRDTAVEVEEANAEAIIDNTQAGLVATNRAGIIEFFNPTAEAIFGHAADQVIGREFTALVAEEERSRVRALLDSSGRPAGSGKADTFVETAGRRADGDLFPMDLAVREFRQRRRKRFMMTVHDVTERKNAQQLLEQRVLEKTKDLREVNRRLTREVTERERTATELRETQDELVQAGKLAALGQISAGIAHELNQPLAAIRSYAHNGAILLDRNRLAEARENLGRIGAMTERMADITSHLKTIAHRPSMRIVPVDVRIVMNNALAFFRTRFQREGIEVVVDVPDPEVLAKAEDIRLEQVFINLLSNAQDAMAGRPERRLRIRIARTGQDIVTEIEDSGLGIPETDLPRIFDPFFTTKEAGRGLGLGLSISGKIIRDFGGHIRVRSCVGRGTTFTVTLPAEVAETTAERMDVDKRAAAHTD